MEENYFLRGVSAALAIFLAGVTSATAIWAVRRFLPRKAAFWLTTPLGTLIRRLVGRERPGRQEVLLSDPKALDQSPRRRAGRE